MHIALYSPAWPPEAYPNGIVTYTKWMRQELLAQGYRVSIFSASVDPDNKDSDIYQIRSSLSDRIVGWVASRLFSRNKTVFDVGESMAACIRHVHTREQIDVIEMEESFGWAASISSATKIPIVVKLHGPAFLHMVEEELRTPFGIEKTRCEGDALRRLPVIISPSRFTLSETILRYALVPNIGECVVNPIGMSYDTLQWRFHRCLCNTLLFVGRFDRIKGGDLVVLAFQQLLRRRPHLNLIFVGPDSGLLQESGSRIYLREFIESLKDTTLSKSISYRGCLGAAEIARLRTHALVTVVASRRENQAYTMLEAMLQGCPIVCTNNSGSRESIEHEVTGLLALEDPFDLAEQICRIFDNPQMGCSLGVAAQEHILKHHAPARVVEQTLGVYRRAIEMHGANSVPQ